MQDSLGEVEEAGVKVDVEVKEDAGGVMLDLVADLEQKLIVVELFPRVLAPACRAFLLEENLRGVEPQGQEPSQDLGLLRVLGRFGEVDDVEVLVGQNPPQRDEVLVREPGKRFLYQSRRRESTAA